jgi:YidC/Oxa1 family membrane protein insertase
MDSNTRKIVFPLLIAVFASFILAIVILGPRSVEEQAADQPETQSADQTQEVVAATSQPTASETAAPETATPETAVSSSGTNPVPALTQNAAPTSDAPSTPAVVVEPPSGGFGTLTASAPGATLADSNGASTLGSLDPAVQRMKLEFASNAAGINQIVFSDFWLNGEARRQADRHNAAVRRGSADPPPLPDDDQRYVLQTAIDLQSASGTTIETPILAVHSLNIRGWGDTEQQVLLFGDVWTEVQPGWFQTEIKDSNSGTTILAVTRRFILPEGRYDITLEQRVENRSGRSLSLSWVQFGPGDLVVDQTTYLRDVRRFHMGYLFDPQRDPDQAHVVSQGMMRERTQVITMAEEFALARDENRIWPNEQAIEEDLRLSWFGATNRYFSLCVHAPYDPPSNPSRQMSAIDRIEPAIGSAANDEQTLSTSLHGTWRDVAPEAVAQWDLGVYAGPLQREVLKEEQPYRALHMGGLILYLMSGCCTFCTFAWLADFMVVFLSFIHSGVFDWGVSIMILVCVVRLLLHPITRKGQIGMQRSAKAMGEIKPELDKLRERFPNDQEKMRQEQMRLMQEKGVNPLGCATGMLPMFLQMPIWIALYAVLFFAFELRQEWAFYGVFQLFDGWAFLGDLSAPDNFIDFGVSYDILFFQFTGINLLPLLMGVVFFIQQKYMTPPTAATMTDDQKRQQKMMKVMMLVLFPVMLYGAPSGLTLYILTSSVIGTIESRYIRKHLKQTEEAMEQVEADDGQPLSPFAQKLKEKTEKRKIKQDRTGKMYEKMLDNARDKQSRKRQKTKTFKDKKKR